MERNSYSLKTNSKSHSFSRADRAVSWRAVSKRNNSKNHDENGVDTDLTTNSNIFMNKTQSIESLWSESLKFPPNNNYDEPEGYQQLPFSNNNANTLAAPPGLSAGFVNNPMFLPVAPSIANALTQQQSAAFQVFNAPPPSVNSGNYSCSFSHFDPPNTPSFNKPRAQHNQPQPPQQQSWRPLQSVGTNNAPRRELDFTANYKKPFYVTPPKRNKSINRNYRGQNNQMFRNAPRINTEEGPSVASVNAPNVTRYVSLLGMSISDFFNAESRQSKYILLRIDNIPWSVSSESVMEVVRTKSHKQFMVPDTLVLPQNIHMSMDVNTGKTNSVAFVEVSMNQTHASKINQAIRNISKTYMQGRRLNCVLSNYDDMCKHFFPSYQGVLDRNAPVSNLVADYFIGQRDLQALVEICKYYKNFYNRKCPDRPFEYLMSIAINLPWTRTKTVTTIQRDIVYESYKLATGALASHLQKPLILFKMDLMDRLVRTALLCDGFTVKQKNIILATSRMACPEDLVMYTVEETSGEIIDQLISIMDED